MRDLHRHALDDDFAIVWNAAFRAGRESLQSQLAAQRERDGRDAVDGLWAACVALAPWMAAALDDPGACVEFKAAAGAFVDAVTPRVISMQRDCPYQGRCDCLGGCKYGLAVCESRP
jgi:hypothetical protein